MCAVQQLGGDATMLFYKSEEGNEVGHAAAKLHHLSTDVFAELQGHSSKWHELRGAHLASGTCLPRKTQSMRPLRPVWPI